MMISSYQPLTALSDLKMAQLVWNLYREVPLLIRALSSVRTLTCPMQALLAEVPPQSTLFDIGCGNGLFLSLLIANAQITQAVGCDPNVQALDNAKTITDQLLTSGKEMKIDFFEAEDPQNWPDRAFSVVSMIDVMHHVNPKKQRAVFEAAAKRVALGGRLIYKDIGERPFWRASANRLHDLILAKQWINYVPLEKIKAWADACQLKLEKQAYYPRYVYGNELVVFKKAAHH